VEGLTNLFQKLVEIENIEIGLKFDDEASGSHD